MKEMTNIPNKFLYKKKHLRVGLLIVIVAQFSRSIIKFLYKKELNPILWNSKVKISMT